MFTRANLHPYQVDAIEFLKAADARQLIAIMGSGKTTIALHAFVDLKHAGMIDRPGLVVAPLMVAETTWRTEFRKWADTVDLNLEFLLGTAPQRCKALDRSADLYVINYDNLAWLGEHVIDRELLYSVLMADESSKLKNPEAKRTKIMLALGGLAERRWCLTGTPRGQSLLDVWGPAQLVTRGTAFPPFYPWRGANFFTNDIYERHWHPRASVEAKVTAQLQSFTHVVDRSALATRPPVQEIIHDVPLNHTAARLYATLDEGNVTEEVRSLVAKGVLPKNQMAVVGKLMQVCSGAIYDENNEWHRLHDRRLDLLEELYSAHDQPLLVFVTYRHEIIRIRERMPEAREIKPDLLDAWNHGEIPMLICHPASAGHGINLQGGTDTAVWFSLPWSAELFAQANARIVRQGQAAAHVNIHIMMTADRIDEVAYLAVQEKLAEQERLIGELAEPAQ
jgi:SNF2 family DNA or RNA helicase